MICINSMFKMQGLTYIRDIITDEESMILCSYIDSKEWSNTIGRRTQHYGYLYDYKSKSLQKADPIPKIICDILDRIGIEYDQVIINEYLPGQGISKHTDHTKLFGDTIVSISMLSPIHMIFRKDDEDDIILNLEPNRMVMLKGDARYKWTHEIPARKKDDGIMRSRRISITARKCK